MAFIVLTTSVVPLNMKISQAFVQHRPHFIYLIIIIKIDFRPVEPEVLNATDFGLKPFFCVFLVFNPCGSLDLEIDMRFPQDTKVST